MIENNESDNVDKKLEAVNEIIQVFKKYNLKPIDEYILLIQLSNKIIDKM